MELMVVIVLLGILTSAIIPIYRGSLGSTQAEHCVRDLVALIRYAQERAVLDSTEYRLYIAAEEGRFWVARFEGYDAGGRLFAELPETDARVVTLPQDLTFGDLEAREERDSENDVRYGIFFASGACDRIAIELVHRDGRTYTVRTTGTVGQVQLEEGAR